MIETIFFTHRFMGFGVHLSSVDITLHKSAFAAVIIIDCGTGTSPTNGASQIATELRRLHLDEMDTRRIWFLERYPEQRHGEPNIDLQIHSWVEGRSIDVRWAPLKLMLCNAEQDLGEELAERCKSLVMARP